MEELNASYLESKKNGEFFKLAMYQRLGNVMMRAAEKRRRNAARLQAMQEKIRASARANLSRAFLRRS